MEKGREDEMYEMILKMQNDLAHLAISIDKLPCDTHAKHLETLNADMHKREGAVSAMNDRTKKESELETLAALIRRNNIALIGLFVAMIGMIIAIIFAVIK